MLKTYGTRECGWCGDDFTAVKSNQIYCKTECTRRASNQKIIERYHAKKAIRESTDRQCAECGKPLSKYNIETVCNPCQQSRKELDRIELLKRLGFEYIEE
jgi:methylphosphotriester-DNA--protein-cysteine methyltransferase